MLRPRQASAECGSSIPVGHGWTRVLPGGSARLPHAHNSTVVSGNQQLAVGAEGECVSKLLLGDGLFAIPPVFTSISVQGNTLWMTRRTGSDLPCPGRT